VKQIGDYVRAVLGPQQLVVADVGAAHGLPGHVEILRDVADLLLFEPNEQAARELENQYSDLSTRLRVLRVALSENGGARTLYVTNAPTGSSLLAPRKEHAIEIGDSEYFFPVREVPIETRSLRSVLRETGVDRLDLIKLDAQGSECEILRGLGSEHRETILAVEVEIGLQNAYANQPLFSDVDTLLRSWGFQLFDTKPARSHRAKNGDYNYYPEKIFQVDSDSPTLSKRVWELDAIYFRQPDVLLQNRDAAALRRLVSLQSVYGFFPDAYCLVERARAEGVLPSTEALGLLESIRVWHQELQSCVVYRPRMYKRLKRVGSILRRLLCGRRTVRWLER